MGYQRDIFKMRKLEQRRERERERERENKKYLARKIEKKEKHDERKKELVGWLVGLFTEYQPFSGNLMPDQVILITLI